MTTHQSGNRSLQSTETLSLEVTDDILRAMDSRQITTNHQLINRDKTKLVLLGTLQLASKLPDVTVPFLGQQVCPVSSAKDLGVTLDSGLAFNNHISLFSSSLQTSLCKISRVCHPFSKEVLYIMINSIVFSKLFYCSAYFLIILHRPWMLLAG